MMRPETSKQVRVRVRLQMLVVTMMQREHLEASDHPMVGERLDALLGSTFPKLERTAPTYALPTACTVGSGSRMPTTLGILGMEEGVGAPPVSASRR